MTDTIETSDVPRRSDEPGPPTIDSPTLPPLMVFEGDDDLVCVDDTCLPLDVAR